MKQLRETKLFLSFDHHYKRRHDNTAVRGRQPRRKSEAEFDDAILKFRYTLKTTVIFDGLCMGHLGGVCGYIVFQ